ncbi:hypothetical protein BJX63DRAFT_436516 [Aspergillus granulosus]|uniref:Uncharacterized protein n=1 Tax=Aspergillus granulosus TaxID=176169 RepID=A0ABR4GXT5_9EURO
MPSWDKLMPGLHLVALAVGANLKTQNLRRASFAYRGLAHSPPFTASGKKDSLHAVGSLIGTPLAQSPWTTTDYADTVKDKCGLKVFCQASRRCPTRRLIRALSLAGGNPPQRLASLFRGSHDLGSSFDLDVWQKLI